MAAGILTGVATVAVLLVASSPALTSLLAVVLVVLAPTAARLDRRLALNLALVFGWVPAALYLPPALGPRTAAVAALSAGAGLTAAALARGTRLVPTWRRRDVALPVGGVLAALVALPLASPGDPGRALAMLSTGIDNAFHFSMFLEKRLTGAGAGLLPGMDTTGFANYPKGFHSFLAVVAQTRYGDVGASTVELERYAGSQWVVFVLLTLLVTAGFVQALPDRTTAGVTVPGLVIVWSLVLGIPGGLNLVQGHLPFLVAAWVITVAVLLTVTADRVTVLSVVAVLGLVLTATSWTLLLPFAAVAAAYPVVVLWRRQRAGVRWVVALAFGLVALGAAALVVPLAASSAIRDLTRDGTVSRVSPIVLVLLIVAPLLIVLDLRRRLGERMPLLPHLTVLAAGVAQLAVLAAYLLSATGTLTYYFWKLAIATLIVTLPLTAQVVAVAVSRTAPSERARPTTRVLVATIVSVVALVGLGSALQKFAAPSAAWAAGIPTLLADRASSDSAGDVDAVISLATTTTLRDAERTTLIATREEDMLAGHASVWFHALGPTTSGRAMSTNDQLFEIGEHPNDFALVVALARSALEAPDGRVVVTDPTTFAEITRLVEPGGADRVVLVTPTP